MWEIVQQIASWGWGDFFKVAAGASVGAAAVQGGIALYIHKSSSKRQATYLAMRVAIALETYAFDCLKLIDENRNAPHFPDQEFPNWNTKLPPHPLYPEELEGWRALDQKLAGRALSFPTRLAASQASIGEACEYFEDEIEERVAEQAAERGLDAWVLAVDLRSRYKLPPLEALWEPATNLHRALQSSQAKRAENDTRLMSDAGSG